MRDTGERESKRERELVLAYIPLLPMAMSGVDAADKSNVVAQSVNGNVLSTCRQCR